MSLKQKLGLDLSEYTAGWNKASTIASTGAAGLSKAVERKLGLHDVFKSFVASVGIDAEKIANFIAEKFGVGEKQRKEFEDLGELSDKVADANLKNMRAQMTEEKRYQLDLINRDRLLKRIADRQIRTTADLIAQKKDELALAEKIGDVQEFEAKRAAEIARKEKEASEARTAAADKRFQSSIKPLSLKKQASRLVEDIKLQQSNLDNFVGSIENPEKIADRIKSEKEQLNDLLKNQIPAEEKEKAEKRAELQTRFDRQLRNVNEDRTNLSNAIGDRGKLSLTELASIGSFQAGVSADVSSQSGGARDVLDLQKKAEQARLGGNADDATALLAQADKLKSGLSALNSSERKDPFEEYKKALAKSEEELGDIKKILTGKFANE